MPKKALSILLIIALLSLLSSCSKQTRIDFSELLRRTEKEYKEAGINLEDAFFSGGEWFLFISLCGENDILLTACEDENKFLTSVGISTVRIQNEEQTKVFAEFCTSVAASFMSNVPTEPLLTELGLFEEGLIFSDEVRFAEYGRFNASFFNAEMGSTVRIEIS